jgi:hypothetical protein
VLPVMAPMNPVLHELPRDTFDPAVLALCEWVSARQD